MPSLGFFLLSEPKERHGSRKHLSSLGPATAGPGTREGLVAKDTAPNVTPPAEVMTLGEQVAVRLENYYIVIVELENGD